MTWNWDVKRTWKNSPPMPDNETIRSINLMCYLLHNLPYRAVYDDDIENVVERILINLDRFPVELQVGSDGLEYDVQGTLKNALVSITRISGFPPPHSTSPSGIKLRHYFEFQGPPTNPSVLLDIAEILRQLPSSVSHFCLPFLRFYYDATLRITPDRMTEFLRVLGSYTLFDIYTLGYSTKYQAQKIEIGNAQRDGILFSYRSGPGVLTPPPRNGKTCSGGSCIPGNPQDWCNSDEQGNCTIGS